MEFLRLGDMTLFICFLRSALSSSHYLCFYSQRAHGSSQRSRMFQWCSHGLLRVLGEEDKEERGSCLLFIPAGGALLSTSWASVCWNPVPPSPYGLDQLALAFSVAEREVKRTIPGGLEGRGLSRIHSGRLPGSSLSHFTSTWLGRLVIQTLHTAVSVPCRCSLLAKFSMACCSHPRRYQTLGWTGNRTGQSQLWLVLLSEGAEEAGCWIMPQTCTDHL